MTKLHRSGEQQWGWIRLRVGLSEAEFHRRAEAFAPAGRAPDIGEVWRSPEPGQPEVDCSLGQGLQERGHEVEVEPDIDVFGCAQVIWRQPSGAYVAGSDGRTDGCALGY